MRDYRSILVGIDFQPWSEGALRVAVRLGRACGASIRAMHVVDTAAISTLQEVLSDVQRAEQRALGLHALFAHLPKSDSADASNVQACVVDSAMHAWQELVRRVPDAADLPIEVPVGNRRSELIEAVRRTQADLLVLGAHGDRPAKVGFGTVATMCVRRAPSDVLLVRGTQPQPFRCVLAGVDFSEDSAAALHRAAAIARIDGAALHAVHVIEPEMHGLPGLALKAEVIERHRRVLDFRLRQFVRARLGENAAQCAMAEDHYDYNGIVARAAQLGADLIVIGKRGRGGLQEFLLGSTAERTLKHSNVSVLAVKSPQNL
jgi:universal stress protein E